MEKRKLIRIEYGAMSSKYRLKCRNKLVGYCTILSHYSNSPGGVAIYYPEELKKDSWLNFSGKTEELIESLFAEVGGFHKFFQDNAEEIKVCYKTIRKMV